MIDIVGIHKRPYAADLQAYNNYYAGGMLMPDMDYNAADYRYGYQGSENTNEISGAGNHYTTEFRELDVRINKWWSIDPKSAASPSFSPYVVNGNNPITMIDPRGDKEYKSLEDLKPDKKTELGKDDWLTSDRENNTDVWKNANAFNRQTENGYNEYETIEQRAYFYSWFQATESKGTRWAGAAAAVSLAVNEMANPSLAGADVTGLADFFGYSSEETRLFANTGNRMIFQDAFPKLRELKRTYDVFNTHLARDWDARMLSQEQTLIQPLYESTSKLDLISASAKQKLPYANTLKGLTGIQISPFPRDGNILDVKQRWAYGMRTMGYRVTPSQMPFAGLEYITRVVFRRLR